MIIIGIDGSTNRTGMAVFEDGKYIEHKLIDLHKEKDNTTRVPHMMVEMVRYIQKVKPDKIIMEKSMLSSNTKTLQMLTMLSGAIMCYAATHSIDFLNPLPGEWRKIVGLKQSNKIKREILKQEAIDAVKQEYGIDVSDDEAEGILLARSGFDLPKIVLAENNEDVLWD